VQILVATSLYSLSLQPLHSLNKHKKDSHILSFPC